MTNKRYGIIVEVKKVDETDNNYKFKGIVYKNTLKEAKDYVKYVDSFDGGLSYNKYRAYGIFDYQEICYKYLNKDVVMD